MHHLQQQQQQQLLAQQQGMVHQHHVNNYQHSQHPQMSQYGHQAIDHHSSELIYSQTGQG
jgi:hypothetical protein